MSMYRRIVALTVGLTLAVVLAFAVPLALLARDVVRTNAIDQAMVNAVALADYLSTASFDESDLAQYVARVTERSTGSAAVRLPDGRVVGAVPAEAFPSGGHTDDGDRHGNGGAGPTASDAWATSHRPPRPTSTAGWRRSRPR